jgi:hypothetical protein
MRTAIKVIRLDYSNGKILSVKAEKPTEERS